MAQKEEPTDQDLPNPCWQLLSIPPRCLGLMAIYDLNLPDIVQLVRAWSNIHADRSPLSGLDQSPGGLNPSHCLPDR